ncbi:sugar ABC transporter permease [Tessaracoccus sp. MC1865]|uniref:ABC transporter permease n=1 Tax=Tessaracoccus flavus TaxID=1610493 RepID=A0A1Q2CBU3_9ACTN|nr:MULTISPECIES: sugar ABC transporter permease [Tessaracoccus]AQP43583.1 ABC transporter permease [Tessaracoccus flavus]MBB1482252.1 sugar ABC transporter permease [Tessaracoccus sp. MC1865]QTO38275.1 sugar ABC transporter permease [Tessaracoccus sp. MC1865]SDY87815.1 carbohydrate ABC transporter membrane protein 1, CUT1 family [Tessaracoccus flavus]
MSTTTVTPPKRRSGVRTSRSDRIVLTLMLAVPLLIVLGLIWGPALITVALSFTTWDGIGSLDTIKFVGVQNYVDLATIYPPFWPALWHNVLWLIVLFAVFTPLGMFLAILLDKELRGTKFYQTALYLPVVLSAALVGFIWQLMYSRDQGLINAMLGTTIDWYGDPSINLWAAMVANGWRHTGYIMLLYLSGLKGVDPALREAAQIDGANQRQTYLRIIFPVMRPINIIVLTITVIEGLRAFDLAWIINRGRNGLELISTLVTTNVIGEASRIGFGSALATIMLLISSVFIVIQLRVVMKGDH